LFTVFFAFSPASTSNHSILRVFPYAARTAPSKTSCEACQMSGPVPSPSMYGMIGWAGTCSTPSLIVIVSPWVGGFKFLYSGAVDVVMVIRLLRQ